MGPGHCHDSRRHSNTARPTPRASPSVPLPEGVESAGCAAGASPVTWSMQTRWRSPLPPGEGPREWRAGGAGEAP
jgi:hypothetical protein